MTTATQPPATTRTEPENQSGGAGDERGARVPAQFTYRDGRLSPPLITVPAMFRIAVTIALPDGRRHRIAIGEVKVEASAGKLSTTLPGLRKGRSVSIRIDGRVGGRIVSGLRPGP